MNKVYRCPICEKDRPSFKWPVSTFHDDGTESLACPDCGHEVHESKLDTIRVDESED